MVCNGIVSLQLVSSGFSAPRRPIYCVIWQRLIGPFVAQGDNGIVYPENRRPVASVVSKCPASVDTMKVAYWRETGV